AAVPHRLLFRPAGTNEMGVDDASLDLGGLLGVVGVVPGGACQFRLADGRGITGLERPAQLHGVCGALEQELQFWEQVRPVVLNLFPRESRFEYNDGGYLTLSFIPTLGTMILGLVAGVWMRESQKTPAKRLLLAGVAGVAAGLALHYLRVCPVVKRI